MLKVYLVIVLSPFHCICNKWHFCHVLDAVARCAVKPVMQNISVHLLHYEMSKHILKVFAPSGETTILVFPNQTIMQYSDGNLCDRASNASGLWEICDFRPISRFILEMIQDRAIVTMECQCELLCDLTNGAISNWCYCQWPWMTLNRETW